VTPLGLGSLGPNLSSTALTASSAYVPAGSGSTLTATVTGMTVTSTGTQQLTTVPGPTPAGAVQFYQNGAAIGTPVALNAGGVATYPLTTTCANVNQQLVLTAAYTGSPTYQGSIGPSLPTGETGLSGGAGQTLNGTVIVNPLIVSVAAGTCPTFTITPATSSVTVSTAGAPIAATLTVASVNGFAGTITLSATSTEGTSYVPVFYFSPASVVALSASGSGSSAMLTITLTGIEAKLRVPSAPGQDDSGTLLAWQATANSGSQTSWYGAGSGVTIASLLLLMLPRRRRLSGLLLAVLAIALVGGVSGCGSSGTASAAPQSNPYAGTYVVTIVGTPSSSSNSLSPASAMITFNVQ
jgi:hypothetical protein